MRCSICNITGTEVKQCMICERDYCNSHFEDHENCLRPGKEEDAPIVQKAKKLKSNEDLTEKSTKSKDENRSEDCLPIAVEGDSADIEQQNKKQKLKHAESSAKLNEEDRKIEGSVSLNEKNTFNIIDEPILEIHHIDVGQGESTLIRCIPIVIDDKKDKPINILIDGGIKTRGGGTVVRYLTKLGIKKLDIVICSHYDGDHYQGLVIVNKYIKIKRFIHPVEKKNIFGSWTTSNGPNEFIKLLCEEKVVIEYPKKILLSHELHNGKKRPIEFRLECLGVVQPDLGGYKNNNSSIPLVVTFGEFRYFTAGDLEQEDENSLINKFAKHICAFKCGHHGSQQSTSEQFLNIIEPTTAFISCGKHAHFHPRQEVIDRLVKCNTIQQFYLTNCFHDRKHINSNYHEKSDTIKGRVAGDASHFGTIVLLATASQVDKHQFFVGYYDDGAWEAIDNGSKNCWRWVMHECKKEKYNIDIPNGYCKDLSEYVSLDAYKSLSISDKKGKQVVVGNEADLKQWKRDVASHHHHFHLEENDVIFHRFKEPEETSSSKREKTYINASEWLWDLLHNEKTESVLNRFIKCREDDYYDVPKKDREKYTITKMEKLFESQLKKSLIAKFDEDYNIIINIVKTHPAGSSEYEFEESIVLTKEEKEQLVAKKFEEQVVKSSYFELLFREYKNRALKSLKAIIVESNEKNNPNKD